MKLFCLIAPAGSVALSEELGLLALKIKRLSSWPVNSGHPQRAAQVVRTRGRARHLQPAAIFLMGLVGVHKDVTV